MAAFEVIALDTATPQLRAPGASDTYTFPRAVEMPLGTANGVLYLNGSKVVTSGSALTFDGTNLGVGTSLVGAGKIDAISNGTSVLNARATSSGAGQSVTVIRATDSGNANYANALYVGVEHAWFNGGSEQMRLTSTGLGIGTNSPSRKLDVVAADSTAIRALSGASGSYVSYGIGRTTEEAYISIAAAANNFITGSAAGDITINNNTGNVLITAGGSATQLYLNTSGNLGLGVTPSAWDAAFKAMQVEGASVSTIDNDEVNLSLNANYSSAVWKYIGSSFATQYRQGSGTHKWYTAPSGTADNAISFTQAMMLDASGNLLVGTTSSSFKLNVTTQSGADRDVFIAGISGGSNGFYVQWNHATAKTHVRIADIPISSAGLPSGTLWNDGGTLKIT